jgi:methylmalonyl-CoA epimerase
VVARGIHHVGVAVTDLDEALLTYARLFGATLEHRSSVAEQGVEAAAVLVGADRLELLAPTEDDTPVCRFLASRGPGLHHVAYDVEDVPAALEDLVAAGAQLVDVMKVALGGRAAEEIVFGRVTNGASNDLEKVTSLARQMVFEFGMSDMATSRTMRADNYALSEETKRMRDSEQARLTDHAYEEAKRLLTKHRVTLDRLATALLEKETLVRDELKVLFADLSPESRAAETVGTVRVLPAAGE